MMPFLNLLLRSLESHTPASARTWVPSVVLCFVSSSRVCRGETQAEWLHKCWCFFYLHRSQTCWIRAQWLTAAAAELSEDRPSPLLHRTLYCDSSYPSSCGLLSKDKVIHKIVNWSQRSHVFTVHIGSTESRALQSDVGETLLPSWNLIALCQKQNDLDLKFTYRI